MSLRDDHVQIVADISAATSTLDKIAMRLDCKRLHYDLWEQARFLNVRLGQKMRDEPQR